MATRINEQEGMDIGRELSHTHPFVIEGKPLHGSNQWPDENEHPQLRGFRDTMLSYFDGVEVRRDNRSMFCGLSGVPNASSSALSATSFDGICNCIWDPS